MSDDRTDFLNANVELLLDLFNWNAPDHQHTRIQALGWLQEALDEAYALYENGGGDAAQGIARLVRRADEQETKR